LPDEDETAIDAGESDTMAVSPWRRSLPGVFGLSEEGESARWDGEAEEIGMDGYRLRRRQETFRV
jgi:hypothetical protein